MDWKKNSRILFLLGAMFCSLWSYADTVWVDVRTAFEHTIDNIEGDIRISHGEIVEEIHKIYPDKDTEISLYCRSGARAGKAMSALKEAGYTKVSNIGGIDDARKQRGLSE
jgi:phage shock protein E